ncbi:MAG: GyrI-like domain-containing protein [Methanomicrobiaceae archaeon]|nr:GyrI-like domain-containing protein [Methanomicrobiaceae archaeon]
MPNERIPIGRFSEVTRLSRKALYCYEKKHLLVAAELDICTGYRYYSAQQIERGIWIAALTDLGFSLDEIALLLERKHTDDPEVRTLLAERLRATRAEIRRLGMVERILAAEDPFLELFSMHLEAWKIEDIPATRALTIRGEGPYHKLLTSLIGQICEQMATPENVRQGVKATGPIGSVYIGEDCDEHGGLVEVFLPISGTVTVRNPAIEVKIIPAATVVSALHRGPYHTLGMAHTKIFEYLQERGFESAGSPRELYLNDPGITPEEDLLTEIQYPVRKKG